MRDEAGSARLKTRGKDRKSIIRMRIIIAANRKGKRLFQQQLQKSSAQTVPPSAQQKRGGTFASDGFFGIAAALGDFANALLREAVKSIFVRLQRSICERIFALRRRNSPQYRPFPARAQAGGAARLYQVPLRKSSARSTASLEFFQSSFS